VTDTIIEARDITRNFGDFQAVDKLNLKIKKGVFVHFLVGLKKFSYFFITKILVF